MTSLLSRSDGLGQALESLVSGQLAVEMLRHDIEHGFLDGRWLSMAMSQRASERAARCRIGKVLHALLAAIVELGIRCVGTCRDRTLDRVECDLERWIVDGRSHLQLGVALFFTDIEHHELVGVEE